MTAWLWLDARDALAIHDRSLVLHGGAAGVRDEGLLQSALARPQQLDAYGETVDVVKLAAAYTAGILQNHPFIDGNKRIGFATAALFLALNGLRLGASEVEVVLQTLALAAGEITEADYAAWLKKNSKRA